MKLLASLISFVLLSGSVACAELTREQARQALDDLWDVHQETIRKERAGEMADKAIQIGGQVMRYDYKKYGSPPTDGWSLFISLHGGGNAPAAVNESQWKNQIRLGDAYRPENAIYLAPRAPTNTWNLWHQAHIDTFIDRLIENFVVLEDVDPNRVYLMGYSAGGDGVYQLAPRIADRLAGAAAMGGHPNEASPLGLRNIAFALHTGGKDSAYKRNEVALEWKTNLKKLRAADPDGYRAQVEIHPDMGHWMKLKDRMAIPWLQQFARNPLPRKVVWFQDDVLHHHYYWLALPEGEAEKGQQVTASIEGQSVRIEKCEGVQHLLIRFNDAIIDLDQPIRVLGPEGATLYAGQLKRTRHTIERTFRERRDRALTFPAELLINWTEN